MAKSKISFELRSTNTEKNAVYVPDDKSINKLELELSFDDAVTFLANSEAFSFYMAIPKAWTENIKVECPDQEGWTYKKIDSIQGDYHQLNFTPSASITFSKNKKLIFEISDFIIEDSKEQFGSYVYKGRWQPLGVLVIIKQPSLALANIKDKIFVVGQGSPSKNLQGVAKELDVLYNDKQTYKQDINFKFYTPEVIAIKAGAEIKFHFIFGTENDYALCTKNDVNDIKATIISNYNDSFEVERIESDFQNGIIRVKVKKDVSTGKGNVLFTLFFKDIIVSKPAHDTKDIMGTILISYLNFEGYNDGVDAFAYQKELVPDGSITLLNDKEKYDYDKPFELMLDLKFVKEIVKIEYTNLVDQKSTFYTLPVKIDPREISKRPLCNFISFKVHYFDYNSKDIKIQIFTFEIKFPDPVIVHNLTEEKIFNGMMVHDYNSSKIFTWDIKNSFDVEIEYNIIKDIDNVKKEENKKEKIGNNGKIYFTSKNTHLKNGQYPPYPKGYLNLFIEPLDPSNKTKIKIEEIF